MRRGRRGCRAPGGCGGRRRPGPASGGRSRRAGRGWDLVRVVADDLDAHDRARSALVELAGGVEEPRAEPEARRRRDAGRAAPRAPLRARRPRGRPDRRTPGGRGGRRAGAGRGGRRAAAAGTSAPPSSSTSAVAALAAATSGWSKGCTPRAAPVSATASSMVTTMWPMPCGLASEPPTRAGWPAASSSSIGTWARNSAVVAVHLRRRRAARPRSARRRCRPCRATRRRAARPRAPSPSSAGSRTKVTLSRPARTPAAIVAASCRAGFCVRVDVGRAVRRARRARPGGGPRRRRP